MAVNTIAAMPSWLAASSIAAFGFRSTQISIRNLPGVRTSTSTNPRAIRPMPSTPKTMLRPAPERRSASTAHTVAETDLQRAQVPLALVRRHLAPVLLPLLPLVAQEEVEDVLAQYLGDQFGPRHHVDRLGQVLRQRVVAHRLALGRGQRPHVVLGARGQLVPLLDALETGTEHDRERQVRVGRRVDRADLDAGRVGLAE